MVVFVDGEIGGFLITKIGDRKFPIRKVGLPPSKWPNYTMGLWGWSRRDVMGISHPDLESGHFLWFRFFSFQDPIDLKKSGWLGPETCIIKGLLKILATKMAWSWGSIMTTRIIQMVGYKSTGAPRFF